MKSWEEKQLIDVAKSWNYVQLSTKLEVTSNVVKWSWNDVIDMCFLNRGRWHSIICDNLSLCVNTSKDVIRGPSELVGC